MDNGGCPATHVFYYSTGAETIHFTGLLRSGTTLREDLLLWVWRLAVQVQGASLLGFGGRCPSRLLTGNFSLSPYVVEVGQASSQGSFIKPRNRKQGAEL